MAGGTRNFHEALRREVAVEGSSDRGFGLTMAGVLALVGAVRLWHGAASGPWWLGGAALFLVLALAAPGLLRPLNRAWLRLGLLLYRVVNPVVMALLFFLAVTPMALLMRLFGKRPLGLAREPAAPSYWIPRTPPGPEPSTMDRQF